MQRGQALTVTPNAVAELIRQASFAGTPGLMHIDLVEDSCASGWLYIRLRPGDCAGIPIARADGVTIFAPSNQIGLLKGLCLSYYGDLSGGGFLINAPDGYESSSCGSGFRSSLKN